MAAASTMAGAGVGPVVVKVVALSEPKSLGGTLVGTKPIGRQVWDGGSGGYRVEIDPILTFPPERPLRLPMEML
jgi:hypothetical protein